MIKYKKLVTGHLCRSGGIGRRTGLKILRELNPVPVRSRSSAPRRSKVRFAPFFIFFIQIRLCKLFCYILPSFCERATINSSKSIWGFYMNRPNTLLSFQETCQKLLISKATCRNWIRLKKLTPVFGEGCKAQFAQAQVDSLLQDIRLGKRVSLQSRRNKRHFAGFKFYKD